MMTKISILISSYNRMKLLRRTLWSIATRPPSHPFEVVIADDGSTDDILGELRLYSSRFSWKFIRFNREQFESKTGLRKYFNNASVTNNIAYKHSQGDLIFLQGNEVIPWGTVYDDMVAESFSSPYYMVMSTTYDVPLDVLEASGSYGWNLTPHMVEHCKQWPLQSEHYRSDVTNYISLAPRCLWETLGGYDERYYAGISSEDSDFVRRARKLDRFEMRVIPSISLHQCHQGKTCYYDPSPEIITQERWNEGVRINHAIYHSWDNTHHNRQEWPWGEYGVGEIITNA